MQMQSRSLWLELIDAHGNLMSWRALLTDAAIAVYLNATDCYGGLFFENQMKIIYSATLALKP